MSRANDGRPCSSRATTSPSTTPSRPLSASGSASASSGKVVGGLVAVAAVQAALTAPDGGDRALSVPFPLEGPSRAGGDLTEGGQHRCGCVLRGGHTPEYAPAALSNRAFAEPVGVEQVHPRPRDRGRCGVDGTVQAGLGAAGCVGGLLEIGAAAAGVPAAGGRACAPLPATRGVHERCAGGTSAPLPSLGR